MMNVAKHIAPQHAPSVLQVKQTTNLIDSRFTLATIAGTGTATITAGGTIINFSTAQNAKFRECRITINGQSRFITTFNSTTQANINTAFNSEGAWATGATSVAFTWVVVTQFSGQTGDNGTVLLNNNGAARSPYLAFRNNKVCCKFWADAVNANKYFTYVGAGGDPYAQGSTGYSMVFDVEILGLGLQYSISPVHMGRGNFWQYMGIFDSTKSSSFFGNTTASGTTSYNIAGNTNIVNATKQAYSITQNGNKLIFDNLQRTKSIESRAYLTYDGVPSSVMGHRNNGTGHSESYLYAYWGFSTALPEKTLERLLERIKLNKY
jgi:hypothetical protein